MPRLPEGILRVGERVVGATLAVARGQGGRIATTSVRAGFAMTPLTRGAVQRADVGIGPYEVFTDRIS